MDQTPTDKPGESLSKQARYYRRQRERGLVRFRRVVPKAVARKLYETARKLREGYETPEGVAPIREGDWRPVKIGRRFIGLGPDAHLTKVAVWVPPDLYRELEKIVEDC